MKSKVIMIILTAFIGFVSCEKMDTTPLEMKNIEVTPKQVEVINSWNKFGFDFFKQVSALSPGEVNLMISPVSVSMALGMTRNGANGTTLEAMNDVLAFGNSTDQEINESYKYLIETFIGLDPSVKLAIANSIWYSNTFSVEQAFINSNKTFFNSQVKSLDFSNPSSVDVINNWVSENTNKLIPSIIEDIPGNAVMYLINAIYFKGQWKNQFEKDKTSPKSFTLSNGSRIQVPMMSQMVDLPVFHTTSFSAVEIPYNRGNFVMTIILPSDDVSIEQVTAQLTSENWNTWKESFRETPIELQLPRFKFKYTEEKMVDILTTMGMGVAFNPDNANFSRINSTSQLYISDVKHKTFIETNEEGTEAAAVTSVEMGVTSAGPSSNQFIIDKPFIFTISEKSTGTVLFIGAVENPLLD